jgi:hypothetical protein
MGITQKLLRALKYKARHFLRRQIVAQKSQKPIKEVEEARK